ncbi:pao retrotransposon peptidase domain-containing protein [Phthorimaea operculella]|nr:pao retrotransposon peptidase domain-containing protein [Phthorimaea operculella]
MGIRWPDHSSKSPTGYRGSGMYCIEKKVLQEAGLVAVDTTGGYVVFGPVWRSQDLPEGDTVLYGSVLSEVLQRFWESEEPPTADRRKPEDDECELFYQYNTARCSSGRFVTRLPFLPNRPALGIVHIAIPRKLVPSVGCKATLHGFCDASERGYAAAVYLRTASSTGTVHVRLVMAKSKVAPVRTRWTIPKLELAGAALLARLLNHVTCNLRGTINLDETVYAWTDSRIVLCWLQTSVHTLEVFVANRVSQITGSETPLVWRHVPGEWNPADCASRGCRAPDLVSHPLWWGPQWLTESPQEWPFNECRAPLGPPDRGLRVNVGQLVPKPNPAFLLERYSSLDKLLGVTGWIKRFVNNCRKPQAERNFTPVLSPAERNAALCSLVRVVQAEHFEEEVRLLRDGRGKLKGGIVRLNPIQDEQDVELNNSGGKGLRLDVGAADCSTELVSSGSES